VHETIALGDNNHGEPSSSEHTVRGRFVQLSSGDSQASFATLTEFGVRDDLVSLFVAHDMTARAPSAREMFLNMGSTFLRVEASVSFIFLFALSTVGAAHDKT